MTKMISRLGRFSSLVQKNPTTFLSNHLAACISFQQSRRHLNLHEYQSKSLMQQFKVNIQQFQVADSVESAEQISKKLNVPEYVIKAQILAGGRGKGTFTNGFKGGVHLTRDPKEVAPIVGKMLNQRLVTKQTPADGVIVQRVMVAEALDLARELYLAILMDRDSNNGAGGPVLVASSEGGVDIEEVAEKNPDAIIRQPIDLASGGLTREQALSVARRLHFTEEQANNVVADQLLRLYDMFIQLDCVQVEINPLGETPDGRVVCFDAKFNFDDNAAFRQRQVFEMEDKSENDANEVAADKAGLNYVRMDGNIGCLVNGAGLAMATMDIIQLHGGRPANFLDVGGGVTEPGVVAACNIIAADPAVKSILVNIFGGIVDCLVIARGLVAGMNNLSRPIPCVVRLLGTHMKEAAKYLEDSGLPFVFDNDFSRAAETAVAKIN